MRIISDQHFNTPNDISFFVDANKEFLISRKGVLTGAIDDKRSDEASLKNAWYGDLFRDRLIIKINNKPVTEILCGLGISNNDRNREANALNFFTYLQTICNLNGELLKKFLQAYNQAFLCVSKMLLAVKLEEKFDIYFTQRSNKALTEITIEANRVIIHNYFNVEQIFSNFDPDRPFTLPSLARNGHYDIEEILELKLDPYPGFKVVEIKVNNLTIENFIDTYFPNYDSKIFNFNFARLTKTMCFENLLGTINSIGSNLFGSHPQQSLLQNLLEKYRKSIFVSIALYKVFDITKSFMDLGKSCKIVKFENYRPWMSRFLLYTMFLVTPVDGKKCLFTEIVNCGSELIEAIQQNLLVILKIEISLGILPSETKMHVFFNKDPFEDLFFI
jgi:hypothetical protein